MSQNNQILEYLQEHEYITSMDAFRKYGCTRLSARIYDLKQLGYRIEGVRETSKNRFGIPCSYVKYKLMMETK